mmetsp:Transcript_16520/g.19152  ORF Transcript_16520/g.19152 Transcript_16520/m.19152 type:complete len:129 (+) Transcript_16520:110-496(+)
MLSWGHDEYMYQMLKFNGCTLPECGLNMIRLHSFYPWHDKRAYTHFECPEDAETLKWVKEFNKFDLYSKDQNIQVFYAILNHSDSHSLNDSMRISSCISVVMSHEVRKSKPLDMRRSRWRRLWETLSL